VSCSAFLIEAICIDIGPICPHGTQVLFFSFTLIILLMLGTFYVVLQTGAIRLNGEWARTSIIWWLLPKKMTQPCGLCRPITPALDLSLSAIHPLPLQGQAARASTSGSAYTHLRLRNKLTPHSLCFNCSQGGTWPFWASLKTAILNGPLSEQLWVSALVFCYNLNFPWSGKSRCTSFYLFFVKR